MANWERGKERGKKKCIFFLLFCKESISRTEMFTRYPHFVFSNGNYLNLDLNLSSITYTHWHFRFLDHVSFIRWSSQFSSVWTDMHALTINPKSQCAPTKCFFFINFFFLFRCSNQQSRELPMQKLFYI